VHAMLDRGVSRKLPGPAVTTTTTTAPSSSENPHYGSRLPRDERDTPQKVKTRRHAGK
jgi:hypothetical protein